MRTGSGDAYSIVFSAAGAFVRGYDHESPMRPYRDGRLWPGLLDGVPEVFAGCVTEPAFSGSAGPREATVCLWRPAGDDRWHAGLSAGDHPDGADRLFAVLLDGSGRAWREFAADYYETAVSLAAVLAPRPLTEELVRSRNPALTLAGLAGDVDEIGVPEASAG